MKISPDSTGFTLLLAFMMAMVSLSVDTTLPAMPALQSVFSASPAEVQATLTAYLLGMVAGQLFCGPLSDRYGRRPVLLGGLALFIVSCALCALAASLATLSAWRFVMGVAAVSGPVLARAVIRDHHGGAQAARLMSRVMVVFTLSPIVTPLVGGLLVSTAGWRSIYVFIALVGIVLAAVVATSLEETAPAERAPFTVMQMLRNFKFLLGERSYLGPMLTGCASQLGIFAFVTNSSFVAANVLGFTPRQFGALFSFVMLGHIAGAQLGSRLVMRHGIRGMLRAGAVLGLLGGVSIAALALAGVQSVAAIAVPMLVYLGGAGIVIPCASAEAMTPFPKIAGAASSLQLMTQLVGGAVLGVVISASFDGTTRPMALAIGACGVALFALERLFSISGTRGTIPAGRNP